MKTDTTEANKLQGQASPEAQRGQTEHNYLRLLCAGNQLKPYLEADLNSHEPWESEIEEFLEALHMLQA
jgi:hypothetical protein